MCFASWKLPGDVSDALFLLFSCWIRMIRILWSHRKMERKQTPWQKWPRSLPLWRSKINQKIGWDFSWSSVMTCGDRFRVSTAAVRSRTCTLVTSTSCTVPPCQEAARVTFGWTMKDSPKSACRVLRSLPSLEKASWLEKPRKLWSKPAKTPTCTRFLYVLGALSCWSFTWPHLISSSRVSVSLSCSFLLHVPPGNPQIWMGCPHFFDFPIRIHSIAQAPSESCWTQRPRPCTFASSWPSFIGCLDPHGFWMRPMGKYATKYHDEPVNLGYTQCLGNAFFDCHSLRIKWIHCGFKWSIRVGFCIARM